MKTTLVRLRSFAGKHRLPLAAALSMGIVSSPAYAAMDFTQGMTTLGTALIIIFGILVIVAAAYKAWELVLDHRNIMPALVGLVFGISLVAGGAWYMTQLGANGGGVAAVAL